VAAASLPLNPEVTEGAARQSRHQRIL